MDIIDTKFYCEYDMFDVSAEADSTGSTSNNQTFADITKISTGTDYLSTQGTMEHNFFTLDESKTEFEDAPSVAFFSSTISKDDGTFTTNPTLTVTFTANHSSTGFTLHFVDDYPLEVKVYWYRVTGELLQTQVFTISSLLQILWKPVENYGKVIFEFTKAVPHRYVKLNRIQYGQITIWDETQLNSGTLLEEVDMISNQLSINTLKVGFIDLLDVMNLGNTDGIHSYIQTKQVFRPYEYIRGTKEFLGRYFVKDFTISEKQVTLSCVDYIGILDMITYDKSDVWSGTKAGDIIDSIMSQAGITAYTVDDNTKNTLLYGTIKPQTCRKALREVLFATQSMVDTSRSSNIVIYQRDSSIRNYIGRDVKVSTAVTKKDYISGITIKYNELTLDDKLSKVTSGTYSIGITKVTFDSPETNLILNIPAASDTSTDISNLTPLPTTTGEIIESGKYYCILKMYSAASVEIDGTNYTSKSFSNTTNVDRLDAGELENIKSFTSTLANSSVAQTIGKAILKYYTYRLQLKIEYLANEERVQNWNIVRNSDASYNDYIAGFESISTDLTNGFVATAQLVGYYNYMNNYYYTGTELYAGNDSII